MKPRTASLSAASFAIGFAVMGAEVAAGRLLAPSFGTSTLVWSSLIGVVLAALAAGSLLGGRWSRRTDALRETFTGVAISGALLATIPVLARPLVARTLAELARGHAFALLAGFAAVLALLVAPVVLLGAASPVFVQVATADEGHAGGTAGRLGALGTLGSLAGTFGCGIVLVPLAGTTATFLVCGGVALAAATAGLVASARGRLVAVASAATLGAAALASRGPAPTLRASAAEDGPRVVLERETAQNHVRVVDDAWTRTLSLNDGYAAQTIARKDGRAYLRGVWGYYAVAPALTQRPPERVLVLGLGGGTSARDYAERLRGAEVVAVELDPGVVEVARSHFGLPASVEVHAEDARTFLARDARSFDLIVMDAFQFPYVPFQLTTRELFAEVKAKLRPGGAFLVNVGRKGDELGVVHAVATTLETSFRHVSGANVPHATNTILVATDHRLEEAGGERNVRFDDAERRDLADLAPLAPWVVPAAARIVATDDRAPVEWLTNGIVLRELARLARAGS